MKKRERKGREEQGGKERNERGAGRAKKNKRERGADREDGDQIPGRCTQREKERTETEDEAEQKEKEERGGSIRSLRQQAVEEVVGGEGPDRDKKTECGLYSSFTVCWPYATH